MANKTAKIKIDLSEKIAVVIGGTGSIGQEICSSLLDSGAKVIAVSPEKDSGSLPENPKMFFYQADVTKGKSLKDLGEKILKRFKKIDILVLAQGIQLRKPFLDFSTDEWNNIIKVNLTGTFLACKYLVKPMVAQKSGKVIGITSLTSEFGIRNISAYAASKGGMTQFLKTVAIEMAGYGINVNMIAPGRILTKMTAGLLKDKKTRNSNLKCIPMGRFGLPADIAGAVLFLASSASDYITGQTVFIDGGWMAGMGNPND